MTNKGKDVNRSNWPTGSARSVDRQDPGRTYDVNGTELQLKMNSAGKGPCGTFGSPGWKRREETVVVYSSMHGDTRITAISLLRSILNTKGAITVYGLSGQGQNRVRFQRPIGVCGVLCTEEEVEDSNWLYIRCSQMATLYSTDACLSSPLLSATHPPSSISYV